MAETLPFFCCQLPVLREQLNFLRHHAYQVIRQHDQMVLHRDRQAPQCAEQTCFGRSENVRLMPVRSDQFARREPEHARHISKGGWSKQEVIRFLFEHWGSSAGELRRCGGELDEIKGLSDDAFVPAAAVPESIKVVVAGANNAGESTLLLGYGPCAGPRLIEEA